MATLADIRTAVSSKLGMDSTAGGTDELAIDGWANAAVRDLLVRTHCHVNCLDITLTADEWKYDLSASVLAFKHLVDSDSNPVQVVTFPDLLELRRADNTDGSSVPLRAAMLGGNLFAVWPTPTAGDTITAFYVPLPTEMSDGAHDPSNATYGGIPVEFHYGIELYALAQGSDHEHEQRTQSGLKYTQEYELFVARMKGALNRKLGKKGPVRVGRRRMVRPANDVDLIGW